MLLRVVEGDDLNRDLQVLGDFLRLVREDEALGRRQVEAVIVALGEYQQEPAQDGDQDDLDGQEDSVLRCLSPAGDQARHGRQRTPRHLRTPSDSNVRNKKNATKRVKKATS